MPDLRIRYSGQEAERVVYKLRREVISESFYNIKSRLEKVRNYCTMMLDRLELIYDKITKTEEIARQNEERAENGGQPSNITSLRSEVLLGEIANCERAIDDVHSYLDTLSSFDDALDRCIFDSRRIEADAMRSAIRLMESMESYMRVKPTGAEVFYSEVPKINKFS